METLEARQLLATFAVENVLDAGPGSLRAAIEDANALAGRDTITFDIPGAGPHTIELESGLPEITESVTIEGTSEPDYAGEGPVVEVLGSQLPTYSHGLIVRAPDTTIRGLSLGGFSGQAIRDVYHAGGTLIEQNYLGVRADGETAAPNGMGLAVEGNPEAEYAVRATVRGNLVSGNVGTGVSLGSTKDVLVVGNVIGANASGGAALPNYEGIVLSSVIDAQIGGDGPEMGNLISGNKDNGVHIAGASTGNKLQGNYIGTDLLAATALPNKTGIYIQATASANLVGVENAASQRNVISGNTSIGVAILGNDNQLAGNYVGVDASGTAAIPNNSSIGGIRVLGAGNVIGVDGDGIGDDLEGNLISGNDGSGVRVDGEGADGNIIAGNLIGTRSDGNSALPNGQAITVLFGPAGTRIGTNGDSISDELEGNVIAGNLRGINLRQAAGSIIAGNAIGIGQQGAPLGNGSGVFGSALFLGEEVVDSQIGANADGVSDDHETNVIAYNVHGVLVAGDDALRNSIRGNAIYANTGTAIDLGEDGVTLNDPLDGDTGANELQNHPVISFVSDAPNTEVFGRLSSAADAFYALEFFASPSAGADTREGKTLIHTLDLTTNADGEAAFHFTLPYAIDSSHDVTATATDAAGNTSEFSQGRRPETLLATVEMPFDGNLSVAIYDDAGQIVRTLHEATPTLAGPTPIVWDGRNDFAGAVPGGDYQWRAIYSQAEAIDDGQVGDASDVPYGLGEHSASASAVAVDAAGNVYESSGWEEAHIDLRKWDAQGNALWGINVGGGAGLAVDDDYVYLSRVVESETRIERYQAADGQLATWATFPAGYLSIHSAAEGFHNATLGLAVDGTRLWVSNRDDDRIEVYDKSTGILLSQFAVVDPAGLAADGAGNVWAAHSGTSVTLYDSQGAVLDQIAGFDRPYAVALGPGSDGNPTSLYVGEVGTGKVREYSLAGVAPVELRQLFGAAEPGPISDDRLYWPTTGRAGLAVDGDGRMILADDGNRRVLEFDADGVLLRKRYSEFQPAPYVDAAVDPNMLLSTWMQYDVDYATGDWEVTHNWRPADDQYYGAMAQRRRLSNGQDYIFFFGIYDQGPAERYVTAVYALEPSGMRRSAMIASDATGLWNWTDSDGDGEVEDSEKVYVTDATSADFEVRAPGVWIDGEGDAWIAKWRNQLDGFGKAKSSIEIPLLGFDAHGNPLYRWADRQTAVEPDLSSWRFDANNLRVSEATGEILLVGTTTRNPDLSLFWMGGTAIDRRAADGTRISLLPISGPPGQSGHTGDDRNIVAIALDDSGEYFYTGHSGGDQHWVHMYTIDGLRVTTGFIGPENGGHGGWIDHGMGIAALSHPETGERYVYAEEVYYGKSIRYRIDGLDTVQRDAANFSWTADPFLVTNTEDDGDGSLRHAIENANRVPGADTITFDIPGAGPHRIELTTPLPELTDTVTLDGTSEPDYQGTPVVELSGAQLVQSGTGLHIRAPETTVEGLAIVGFQNGAGIYDDSPGGTLIKDNYVGLRADGETVEGNYAGVSLKGLPADIYEARAMIVGNVSSGHSYAGITFGFAEKIVVQGNRIGTDKDGEVAIPNGVGIEIFEQATNNLIGGAGEGEGNLISGNTSQGISLGGVEVTGNFVQGNWIGLNAAGDGALGNGAGIYLNGAVANRIGVESDVSEGNVISGNRQGIQTRNAVANIIAGNIIGADPSGQVAIPNRTGVTFSLASHSNVVGVNGDGIADAIEGNLISGNESAAVHVKDSGVDNNVVAGNRIGTTVGGDASLPNGWAIAVHFGPAGTLIGTNGDGVSDELEGNILAGNLRGVNVRGSSHTVIAGNKIGVGHNGVPLGNGTGVFGAGIMLGDAAVDSRIGTDGDGVSDEIEANAIAYNTSGVVVTRTDALRNSIRGNAIYANDAMQIDLGEDGVTLNDPLDADAGANDLQNYPVLSAIVGGAATQVDGTLNSTPNATFVLEFFASAADGSSNYGGQRVLGAAYVATDENGDASFLVELAGASALGEFVTATATDALGNTSEFSAPLEILVANRPPVAYAAEVVGTEDEQLEIALPGDDPDGDDPDGDVLSAIITRLPAAGRLFQTDGSGTPAAEITVPNVAVADSQRRVLYVPDPDGNGAPYADFGFVLNDGQADSAEATVSIGLLPVNDAPSFSLDADPPKSYENQGLQSVAGFATAILPGPPSATDETVQQLTFDLDVTSTTGSLAFASLPAIDAATGTLTYEAMADTHGTATLLVTLRDDGGVAEDGVDASLPREFTVTVVNLVDLSGQVFADQNNNGQLDSGDAGLPGVTIELYDDQGVVAGIQTTDGVGRYAFADLWPGVYRLEEVQPAGFLDGRETAGSLGGHINNAADHNAISHIAIGVGSTDATGYNFAELRPASASGFVWEDFDSDRVWDTDEVGLSGVEVNLTGTDDRGAQVARTSKTGSDGRYMFAGVRPGIYNISEVQPDGFPDGPDLIGTVDGTPQGNSSSNDLFTDVRLQPGSIAADYNFSEQAAPGMSLVGATLRIAGGNAGEKISVKPTPGDPSLLTARTKNRDTGAVVVKQFNAADVDGIHILGRGSGDMIVIASSIDLPAIVDGGEGDDMIFGGGGDDVIYGGDGDDVLLGRRGIDAVFGQAGNDWIWGNRDNDRLEGGSGHDKIWGLLGDDVILGGSGDDVLFGGQGDDVMDGGEGNDMLWGGAGNDTMTGGSGDDLLLGGVGSDTLVGEEGDDILFGGPGNDSLDGGEGLDLIFNGWRWVWD